jgi:hypothetical protein
MVTSITRPVNEAVAPETHSAAATAEPVHRSVPVVTPTDTVKLSVDAQAHFLQSQGQTLDQIAVSLSLSPQLVASYLGTTPQQLQALSSTLGVEGLQ